MPSAELNTQKCERLFLEIDTRLMDVWSVLADFLPEDHGEVGIIAHVMRVCYEQGYKDSLMEVARDQRGKLYTDNGYHWVPGDEPR